ncbi:MAG: hypothetical protein V3V20_08410 [Algisphaera sp.]
MPSQDDSNYGKRLALDLFGSGWVMFPVAAGLTSLMAGWAVQASTPAFVLAGVASVAVGLGALVTRWFTGADRMADRAEAEYAKEQVAVHKQRLKTLDHRLYRDGNARTNQALGGLKELDRRFAVLRDDPERRPPPEVDSRLQELIELSVRGLERMADLHETLEGLMTQEAKQKVHEARAQLLEEVEQSVDRVVHTLDGLYTYRLDAKRPVEEIAELRNELDTSLIVARKVEDRMAELEKDIATPDSRLRERGTEG